MLIMQLLDIRRSNLKHGVFLLSDTFFHRYYKLVCK